MSLFQILGVWWKDGCRGEKKRKNGKCFEKKNAWQTAEEKNTLSNVPSNCTKRMRTSIYVLENVALYYRVFYSHVCNWTLICLLLCDGC